MNEEIKNYNLKCEGFTEGNITFFPTYKYSEDQTNLLVYDCQDHIPSWTDRILFMINQNKFHFIDDESKNNSEDQKNHFFEYHHKMYYIFRIKF